MVSLWDVVIWVGILLVGISLGYFVAKGGYVQPSTIVGDIWNLTNFTFGNVTG